MFDLPVLLYHVTSKFKYLSGSLADLFVIQVPAFIKTGDLIVVNTTDDSYMTR